MYVDMHRPKLLSAFFRLRAMQDADSLRLSHKQDVYITTSKAQGALQMRDQDTCKSWKRGLRAVKCHLLALTKPLLLLVVLALCSLFFGGPTTQLPHTHTHGILFFLMNARP